MSDLIGYIAAFCTTFAFLPQFFKSVKSKHTGDLSFLMLIIFQIGLICWLIYGILLQELPIIIANSITIILVFLLIFIKIKYG